MIILKDGIRVKRIIGAAGQCKACKAEMFWAETLTGKFMPVVKGKKEWISHFTNCPKASSFRKK